jgi:hypothetical protein
VSRRDDEGTLHTFTHCFNLAMQIRLAGSAPAENP